MYTELQYSTTLPRWNLVVHGLPIEVEAAVSETLPVSVVLGMDVIRVDSVSWRKNYRLRGRQAEGCDGSGNDMSSSPETTRRRNSQEGKVSLFRDQIAQIG